MSMFYNLRHKLPLFTVRWYIEFTALEQCDVISLLLKHKKDIFLPTFWVMWPAFFVTEHSNTPCRQTPETHLSSTLFPVVSRTCPRICPSAPSCWSSRCLCEPCRRSWPAERKKPRGSAQNPRVACPGSLMLLRDSVASRAAVPPETTGGAREPSPNISLVN